MIYYDIAELADVVRELAWYRWIFFTATSNGHRDSEVNQLVLEPARSLCRKLLRCCEGADLEATLAIVTGRFSTRLFAMGTPHNGELIIEYEVVLDTLMSELSRRYFSYIPANKAKPVIEMEREAEGSWCGIWGAFPSTKYDSQEAVYCYSNGRNTACVFHLMLVAEVGLRALARHCKVKFKKGPLEWQEWGDLIREIRSHSSAKLSTVTRGPKKDALSEFYNGSLQQFEGFRDEFRNQVVHARASYDHWQSQRCLGQTHTFMLKLSSHIDEKGRFVRLKDALPSNR